MWTVSAIQMHPKGLIVCDEDATLELHVKVMSYNSVFKQTKTNIYIKLDCKVF